MVSCDATLTIAKNKCPSLERKGAQVSAMFFWLKIQLTKPILLLCSLQQHLCKILMEEYL